jgi:hypothetical protein
MKRSSLYVFAFLCELHVALNGNRPVYRAPYNQQFMLKTCTGSSARLATLMRVLLVHAESRPRQAMNERFDIGQFPS